MGSGVDRLKDGLRAPCAERIAREFGWLAGCAAGLHIRW